MQYFPRDEPFKELQLAVNRQTVYDLARHRTHDTAHNLVRYLEEHVIDNEHLMHRIIIKALERRYKVTLRNIAIDIDKMEVKIEHMKMTLDDLFKDMEATAQNIEKIKAETAADLDNVYNKRADEIEKQLTQNEDENENEDETTKNIEEVKED